MSKLIVDDIELASGDLLSLPPSLVAGKIFPVTNNVIGAGTDVPSANHRLIHDFVTGQPTTITHTFTVDSTSLLSIDIMFSNMRFYGNNGSNENDISYGIGRDDIDINSYNNDQDLNISYSMFRLNDSGTQSDNGQAYGVSHKAFAMGGNRPNAGAYISSSSTNYIGQIETHNHTVFFDKNRTGAAPNFRMVGRSQKPSNGNSMLTWHYASFPNTSAQATDQGMYEGLSSPFTKIAFKIPSTITIYEGQISITEYAR